MPRIYTMQQFFKYPNLALNLACSDPFTWSGTLKYSRHMALIRRALFAFGAFNLVYQNFGMLLYLFLPHEISSNQSVIRQITETGGVMGLTMIGACNMFVMYWHGERIAVLLDKFQQLFPMARDQRRAKFSKRLRGVKTPHRVEHFAVKSNQLMKRTTTAYMFACAYYNCLPIVEYLYECWEPDVKWKYRYQSNTWYPWQNSSNTYSFLSFLAAYICQLQASLTGVAFILAVKFTLYFFATQLQMHFDYLAGALETIDASSANANDELKFLINYHSELLSYCKEINAIFNISFLVNFFTSTVAICLMGFSMVMISLAHAFKYSVGLLSFIVFTLFICYTGSELTESSNKLLNAAFYGNWYEGNLAYRKMILFFIMRSRLPVVLSAYKFTTVSMPTFTTILRSSYSLFTFFQAMGK